MNEVWSVCRAEHHNWFATAHEDGRVRIWAADFAVPVLETGPGRPARSVAVRDEPHAGGLLLAVGRVDGTLDILPLAEPSASRSLPVGMGAIHDLAWVGNRVVMATESGCIASLDGEQLEVAPMSDGPLLSLDVHPDGCRAAVGLSDGSVVVADWWSPRRALGTIDRIGPLSMAWSVGWGPDDLVVAAVGDAIWVGDPTTGHIAFRAAPEMRSMRINAAAWSPDGKHIAHSQGLGLVVRDRAGEIVHSPFFAHGAAPLDLIWLDDRTVVSVDGAGQVVVWVVGEAPQRRQIEGRIDP